MKIQHMVLLKTSSQHWLLTVLYNFCFYIYTSSVVCHFHNITCHKKYNHADQNPRILSGFRKKKYSSGVLRHEQKLVNYCTFVTIVYGKYIEEIIFIISL